MTRSISFIDNETGVMLLRISVPEGSTAKGEIRLPKIGAIALDDDGGAWGFVHHAANSVHVVVTEG